MESGSELSKTVSYYKVKLYMTDRKYLPLKLKVYEYCLHLNFTKFEPNLFFGVYF